MTISALIPLLLATDNPVLPDPASARLAMSMGWVVVLGAACFWAGARLSPLYRWSLSLMVVLWALVPGSASPIFWLGLAFQAPSLMTVLLCLLWVYSKVGRRSESVFSDLGVQALDLKIALFLGVALGWVLLIDTLALWPVSVYAWGFSAAALGGVASVTVVVWAFAAGLKPRAARSRVSSEVVLGVLALFVLTRWPSGNLWDALLDPWLWVALQWVAFRVGLTHWRERQAG
jgi:hypothetical protein